MTFEEKIRKRLNSLYWTKKTHEIVKYSPDGYDEDGIYRRDEWTEYSDVGKTFAGKKLSLEEYLEIENRYVECALDIITQSQCKYLTIGYVEDYDNIGYRCKDRIPAERVDKVLRDMLRCNVFCVLVNLSHKVMIDMGYDYYMHVLCPLEYEDLQELVCSHNLYLNPRVRRILIINE